MTGRATRGKEERLQRICWLRTSQAAIANRLVPGDLPMLSDVVIAFSMHIGCVWAYLLIEQGYAISSLCHWQSQDNGKLAN